MDIKKEVSYVLKVNSIVLLDVKKLRDVVGNDVVEKQCMNIY